MLDTARKQADTMIEEAKARVDALVKEAADRVEYEKRNLEEVRLAAEAFRTQICDAYVKHLEYLKTVEIGTIAQISKDMPTEECLDQAAADGIKASEPTPEEVDVHDIALITDRLDTAE